jgi:hypothetical protein
MDRGPSKTIQLQLGAGNTLGRTWVRGLLSARAVVLGSRSTGLGKMVKEPQARFKVAKWGVYCHTARLQIHPAGLKKFCMTETQG